MALPRRIVTRTEYVENTTNPATSPNGHARLAPGASSPRPPSGIGRLRGANGTTGPTINGRSPMRSRRWWITFLALLLVNYLVISLFLPSQPQPLDIPYTFFKQQIEGGNVSEVTSRGETIQGTFKQSVTYPPTSPGNP